MSTWKITRGAAAILCFGGTPWDNKLCGGGGREGGYGVRTFFSGPVDVVAKTVDAVVTSDESRLSMQRGLLTAVTHALPPCPVPAPDVSAVLRRAGDQPGRRLRLLRRPPLAGPRPHGIRR